MFFLDIDKEIKEIEIPNAVDIDSVTWIVIRHFDWEPLKVHGQVVGANFNCPNCGVP